MEHPIYKYASGSNAISLLEKENGVNLFNFEAERDNTIYYIPYNGGIIDRCPFARAEYYIMDNGKEIKRKEIIEPKERDFLYHLCSPFMKEYPSPNDIIVKDIMKLSDGDSEYIKINLTDGEYISLPKFKKGERYVKMEIGKGYKPEELHLADMYYWDWDD